jgi:GLPGLI family protein
MNNLLKKTFVALLINLAIPNFLVAQTTEVIYRVTSTKRNFDSAQIKYQRLLYNDTMSFYHYLPRTDTFSLNFEEILGTHLINHSVFSHKASLGYTFYFMHKLSPNGDHPMAAIPSNFRYKIISNTTRQILSKNVIEFMIAGKDKIIGSIYCDTTIHAPFGPESFNGAPGLVLYTIDKKRKLKIEAISIKTISDHISMPDFPIYTLESYDKTFKHLSKYGRTRLKESTDMLELFTIPNKK